MFPINKILQHQEDDPCNEQTAEWERNEPYLSILTGMACLGMI